MHILKTLLILSLTSFSLLANDSIIGFWLSESGKAVIEVSKANGKFNGKIVWLRKEQNPETPVVYDEKNPDESQRKTRLKGKLMLKDFVYDDGEYKDGTIYDPNSGKTYSSYMKLENPNKVKLRGYVGISLFGRTSYWTRQKSASPDK